MAAELGLPVSLCGEMASDPNAVLLLVGLGVHQLSMSPVRAARVRVAIRQKDSHELSDLAEQALRAKSSALVKDLLRQLQRRDATPEVGIGRVEG